MQTPLLAADIVKQVKSALGGQIPLSVKFRSGWDLNSLNHVDFGLLMQDSGADFITLHPRTAKQMFAGKSNWEHIATLKAKVHIHVIGNGDILTPEDAQNMLSQTNCDGLMTGRGALGKPWFFKQCRDFLSTGSYNPITKTQVLDSVLKHIDNSLFFKREIVVVREMRSQLCFYTKGLLGGAELRNKINHTETADELKNLLIKGLDSL